MRAATPTRPAREGELAVRPGTLDLPPLDRLPRFVLLPDGSQVPAVRCECDGSCMLCDDDGYRPARIDPDDLPHTVEIYGSAPVCCVTLQRAEWMACEDGVVVDEIEGDVPKRAVRSIVAGEGSSDGVQCVRVGEIRRATAEEIQAMRAEGRM